MTALPKIDDLTTYGDWRDDFKRDGFVIIKGAITKERAEHYRQEFFQWLENFKLGFDRNDPSTWTQDKLPVMHFGGMVSHSIAHEKWQWDLRQEQGLLDAYSLLYATNELITAFDGGNLSLPGPMQEDVHGLVLHNDQNPYKRRLRCAQGIVNLRDNVINYHCWTRGAPAEGWSLLQGPNDGGLVVIKGSHKFFDEYFTTKWQPEDKYSPGGSMHEVDWITYGDEAIEWYKSHGLEEVKVCADAGDLILWDSRTVHKNLPPSGNVDRTCAYVCYEPAAAGTPESLAKKKEVFEQQLQCRHWPISKVQVKDRPMRDGKECPYFRTKPFESPEYTPKLLKLAGVEAY